MCESAANSSSGPMRARSGASVGGRSAEKAAAQLAAQQQELREEWERHSASEAAHAATETAASGMLGESVELERVRDDLRAQTLAIEAREVREVELRAARVAAPSPGEAELR